MVQAFGGGDGRAMAALGSGVGVGCMDLGPIVVDKQLHCTIGAMQHTDRVGEGRYNFYHLVEH